MSFGMKFRSGPDHGDAVPVFRDEDVLIVEGLRIAFELSRRRLHDKLRAGGRHIGTLRLDRRAVTAAPRSLLMPDESSKMGLARFFREWRRAHRARGLAAARDGWDFPARLRTDRAYIAIVARLS